MRIDLLHIVDSIMLGLGILFLAAIVIAVPTGQSSKGSDPLNKTLMETCLTADVSGAICKPKNQLPGDGSTGSRDDSSRTEPETNPLRGSVPYVPRDPCYAYEDKNTLLTCAGPESIYQGVLSVARCIPGELYHTRICILDLIVNEALRILYPDAEI